MEKPSLRITYNVHVKKGLTIWDYKGIDTFKEDIAKEYTSIVKTTPIGLGGGAYQFVIDFFTNLTVKDYCEIIAGYLGKKTFEKVIDSTIDRLIFNPLIKAYKRLKADIDTSKEYVTNDLLDISQLTIELSDTKIFIYSIYPESIIENREQIFTILVKYYLHFIRNEEFPCSIHIPILYDEKFVGMGKPIYRTPLTYGEMLDTSDRNIYFKLWGVKYQYPYETGRFDIEKESLILGENGLFSDVYAFSQ